MRYLDGTYGTDVRFKNYDELAAVMPPQTSFAWTYRWAVVAYHRVRKLFGRADG
jgi:hypothetical protein